jgi:hypothetical protein
MLEALKRLNGGTIHLPARTKDRPDRDRLALRYERFKSAAYAAYYNEARTHRSLNKDGPFGARLSVSVQSRHNRFSAVFTIDIAESNFRYRQDACRIRDRRPAKVVRQARGSAETPRRINFLTIRDVS